MISRRKLTRHLPSGAPRVLAGTRHDTVLQVLNLLSCLVREGHSTHDE